LACDLAFPPATAALPPTGGKPFTRGHEYVPGGLAIFGRRNTNSSAATYNVALACVRARGPREGKDVMTMEGMERESAFFVFFF